MSDRNLKTFFFSPFLASGSTDKSIRVWKLNPVPNPNPVSNHNPLLNPRVIDDVVVSEHCVFFNEEVGIRKIMFLKKYPHLILAGDLVSLNLILTSVGSPPKMS